MVVKSVSAGKRFLGGDKNEGETGGHDFGITISRATILMILSATGSYPVSPFRGKPLCRPAAGSILLIRVSRGDGDSPPW